MSKADFLKQFDSIAALFPIQGKARAAIHNGLDFPTTRDEYWKYTRVAPIVSTDYKQHAPDLNSVADFEIQDGEFKTLVFVNGVYNSKLSDTMPEGVEVHSIAHASGEAKNEMLEHLGAYVSDKNHAFNALNTSYFVDGAFIKVKEQTEVSDPIRILHVSHGEKQATNSRNLILVGKHAQVSFIHQFEGKENDGAFTNALMELVVEEEANASYYLIENEGEQTSHINTTQVVQKRSSTCSVVTVTKTGKLVRNNLNFSITDQGCESNLYGIYFTSDQQHIDNHTYADHQMPNCNSNELYKGVMADRSTGVFNGKIMVHRDAQQTNAFQSNQNILLSDRASVNTKPELEIYADDVKCSHGCTIGQLDEEALFYLQSRGLGKQEASHLLVRAFASEVLELIEVPELRSDIERFVERKFDKVDA